MIFQKPLRTTNLPHILPNNLLLTIHTGVRYATLPASILRNLLDMKITNNFLEMKKINNTRETKIINSIRDTMINRGDKKRIAEGLDRKVGKVEVEAEIEIRGVMNQKE